jgi:hypothetical protein
MNNKKDWTHKEVLMKDIRKLSNFYIFMIDEIEKPLMVKDRIFEERLKPYFLKETHRITREEILSVHWNLHISQGYYIKISGGEISKYDMDPEKYYVSYLEIAGPLGTFQPLCKDDD